jgi:NADPH-dependent 7-cyano-7-deazaguanine reductase QueF
LLGKGLALPYQKEEETLKNVHTHVPFIHIIIMIVTWPEEDTMCPLFSLCDWGTIFVLYLLQSLKSLRESAHHAGISLPTLSSSGSVIPTG